MKTKTNLRKIPLLLLCLFWTKVSLGTYWEFKKSYEDVSIYTSEQGTRLTLNRSASKKHQKITSTVIEENISSKKEMLSFIGITEWNIQKPHVKELKNNITEVILEGSYKDTNQDKIYFKEYHYYKPSEKLQILLTNKESKLLKGDSGFKDIKQFKAKHGF